MHHFRHVTHAGHQRLRPAFVGNGERPLGDVLCKITDAFEIAGNFQHRHDVTEIVGERLALGDHDDHLLLQIPLQLVDHFVARDGVLREFRIAALERVHCLYEKPFCITAHLRDAAIEELELVFVRFDSMFVHAGPRIIPAKAVSRSGP